MCVAGAIYAKDLAGPELRAASPELPAASEEAASEVGPAEPQIKSAARENSSRVNLASASLVPQIQLGATMGP